MDTWVDRYENSHKNANQPRLSHLWRSHDCGFNSALSDRCAGSRRFWEIPLSSFTTGWICQVLGHLIEGKPPEFLKTGGFCWSDFAGG